MAGEQVGHNSRTWAGEESIGMTSMTQEGLTREQDRSIELITKKTRAGNREPNRNTQGRQDNKFKSQL